MRHKSTMSIRSKASNLSVVTAADLRRTLRLSRSGAYNLLKRGGAERVGANALRLPASKLANLLGEELAKTVIEQAQAASEEE